MRGSELVRSWDKLRAGAREELILECVRENKIVEWPFVPVRVALGDEKEGFFYVASDYLAIGDLNDFVYMPVSARMAQRIADVRNWRLPTRRMVDLIWQSATHRLNPLPWGPPYDSSMMSVDRIVSHSNKVRMQIGLPYPTNKLLAGHKKDVVLSNRLRAGKVAIYGWHKYTGEVIQDLNAGSHDDAYLDYSHGIRFVLPSWVCDGQDLDLDASRSGAHASLFSDEGPLRVLRQPGVPDPKNAGMIMEIRKGSTGPEVRDWQTFLAARGYDVGPIDGIFGSKTENATARWQASNGLPITGAPDEASFVVAKNAGFQVPSSIPPAQPMSGQYKFIEAKNYTKANRTKVDLVVIHTMEAPEKPETAENVAKWFAGPNAPKASAHYCLDSDSVVLCVEEKDVAWHAPGANKNGIGLEHAGYAKQSASDWSDSYSEAMLMLSAKLCADICRRWNIPIQRVDVEGLKKGERGITGHADVSLAFKHSDHMDPGKDFPWSQYLELVKKF